MCHGKKPRSSLAQLLGGSSSSKFCCPFCLSSWGDGAYTVTYSFILPTSKFITKCYSLVQTSYPQAYKYGCHGSSTTTHFAHTHQCVDIDNCCGRVHSDLDLLLQYRLADQHTLCAPNISNQLHQPGRKAMMFTARRANNLHHNQPYEKENSAFFGIPTLGLSRLTHYHLCPH